MRQEFGVGEVLQARGVIGHDVGFSWDALGHVAVLVFSLVFCRKDALFGRRPFCCDGFLGHAGLGRGVVHERDYGGVLDWMPFGHGGDLSEHAGVLEVTVCDGACWVVG